MKLDVTTSGRVAVGPPGLARPVPRSARIVMTGQAPYELHLRLVFDERDQRLVVDELVVSRLPRGLPVRGAELARVKLADLVETTLTGEVLDERGWRGVVEDHRDHDQVAVDALVYALAHALGGQRPTQTVALARGLQPGSAIKRVMRARELGYLGEAQKGRSGGLASGTR
ncbi:MAG: hypothetical protein ABW328_10820 [Ilumatobacteraceae bacterium]